MYIQEQPVDYDEVYERVKNLCQGDSIIAKYLVNKLTANARTSYLDRLFFLL
ncbi:hypothetical protein REC12_25720 [Desulfosporosinus sp. PR]|uniref:hypothetical protein n=1 Tax=Candidatus Desulfosporosinus nitrosoreducens TaxID=3401928 RepID=UPI0027F2FA2C|nr:hypothetical protein [Desulfosporosinus sp. PR]MDQ7096998.1 hypothetical protein [Desulfosporosinus sp. PR]